MNQKSSSSGFRIGADDDGIDPYERPDRPDRRRRDTDPRVARLNRRVTRVIVVMTIFFIAVAALAYGMFEKRVLSIRSVDTEALAGIRKTLAELEAAAKRVDGRLAEIALEQNVLKKSMDEKEAPMNEAFMVFEKTAGAMRKDLKKVDDRLEQLDAHLKRIDTEKADAARVAASEKAMEDLKKTDLPALDARMAAIGQSVEPIRTDLQATREAVSRLEETYTQDKDAVSRSVDAVKTELAGLSRDYKQLKKDLVDVLSVTIDQKGLNKAIQNQEKNFRAEVQALSRSLEAKNQAISQLQSDLRNLERRLAAVARTRRPIGTPKPGSFIEQNID